MASTSTLDDRLAAALAAPSAAGILAAYVFGSHAEGRAHHDSDIDVAVLLDRDTYPGAADRFDARLRLIGSTADALGFGDIDLVILNDAPPGLARAIVTRGRRVFCRNPEADHAFVRTTLSRAADLDPFLERMRRIKLAALRR